MAYTNLKLETHDGVAVVTIHRPDKLNALNGETMAELGDVFAALGADASVRGVIVTGSGEKAFVAGADIAELGEQDAGSGREFSRRGQRGFGASERLGKPVGAAVHGFAVGGGCELALACPLRAAAEGVRLGTREVKLGILCGYGGTQRLARLVGRGRALEVLLTGDMIDAAEALRIGLVNRVVPKEMLMAESEALLRKMIANAPMSLRLTLAAVGD